MSADRLAEIKARIEAKLAEWLEFHHHDVRSPLSAAETLRIIEQLEWAEAEVESWKERFPCDGLCSDAPEEDCSRHGRVPADLWGIIGKLSAERDALAAQVARVEALAECFDSVQEGPTGQESDRG